MKFEESQKFRQAWLWILLIATGMIIMGSLGSGFYKQIILGQKFGNNPMNNIGLEIVFTLVVIVYVAMFLLFGFAELTTIIDEKGITYKFFPFQFRHHIITWDEIKKCEVIKYNPILDYGGWGVKSGKRGKAYNVSGSMGLQIFRKSGSPLLIGTQKSTELIDFLVKVK